MSDNIAVVLGTRPEIIKLAPVIHACENNNISYTLVHTGQHYSNSLDSVFFEQLGLPDPDYNLEVGSASHGEQTGEMLIRFETILETISPGTVLVQGDTNSVLAGAIAASKRDIELGHIEAGLRSNDREMPEEINRVLADHAADSLFAPTKHSKQNLLNEGIAQSRIEVTGNTVVDALYRNRSLAIKNSTVCSELGIADQEFCLLTLHRQENVDDPKRFQALLFSASSAAEKHDLPVIYPIHPRAKKRIKEFKLDVPDRLQLIDPQEYLDFIRLEDEATIVLTDSGGVQEESCILGTPCVTLRDSTERPETVSVGANILADHDPATIVASVDKMLAADGNWENPFGDGHAAERILQSVQPQVEVIQT
ncbi:non-hydrolyzing UDP-N-acetylglucosamine 2-epimerase [Halovenus sp. HT40]|uniref:non-hydrolyzing UDP-N-acetylglucosamine 2-epimerase n=1 Tax=Halovenus sp. HT40 TaxID=3126691 RepID=UPI00300F01BD